MRISHSTTSQSCSFGSGDCGGHFSLVNFILLYNLVGFFLILAFCCSFCPVIFIHISCSPICLQQKPSAAWGDYVHVLIFTTNVSQLARKACNTCSTACPKVINKSADREGREEWKSGKKAQELFPDVSLLSSCTHFHFRNMFLCDLF